MQRIICVGTSVHQDEHLKKGFPAELAAKLRSMEDDEREQLERVRWRHHLDPLLMQPLMSMRKRVVWPVAVISCTGMPKTSQKWGSKQYIWCRWGVQQVLKKIEVTVKVQHETFWQYAKRVSIVSLLVVCFFSYPTICQASSPGAEFLMCEMPLWKWMPCDVKKRRRPKIVQDDTVLPDVHCSLRLCRRCCQSSLATSSTPMLPRAPAIRKIFG